MQSVKRIEIIIDTPKCPHSAARSKAGVSGYTVFAMSPARGDRGERRNDEPGRVFKNSLLLTAARPAILTDIIEAIRPILKRRGGICLVSDASGSSTEAARFALMQIFGRSGAELLALFSSNGFGEAASRVGSQAEIAPPGGYAVCAPRFAGGAVARGVGEGRKPL